MQWLEAYLEIIVRWTLYGFLILYSVAAAALIVERLIAWAVVNGKGRALAAQLHGRLAKPDRAELKAVFDASDAPLAQVMSYVLSHGVQESPETTLLLLDDALDEVGGRLRRFMTSLAALAGTAPFLGLLGTVMGIIFTFQAIAGSSSLNSALIASGIALALNTTAVGLVIAIPTFIAYNLLVGKTNAALQQMRMQANRIFVALGDL